MFSLCNPQNKINTINVTCITVSQMRKIEENKTMVKEEEEGGMFVPKTSAHNDSKPCQLVEVSRQVER